MYTFEAKLANLLETLAANGCAIEEHDTNLYKVTVQLGDGWAGEYKGGYWGDCAITNDVLEFEFLVGDVWGDGDCNVGEGIVCVDYVEGSGLAYTGELDELVCEKIAAATNNTVEACGSEQGMQGDEYISLDVAIG